MEISAVLDIFANDNRLYKEFTKHLETATKEISNEFSTKLPVEILESVEEIKKVIAWVSEWDNIIAADPNALIKLQIKLTGQKAYLNQYISFYSVQATNMLIYRRNKKQALMFSLRRMTKDFEETLNKKLTLKDTEWMADLATQKEKNEEFHATYISEYLTNLSYDVKNIVHIIDNQLIEKRQERKESNIGT